MDEGKKGKIGGNTGDVFLDEAAGTLPGKLKDTSDEPFEPVINQLDEWRVTIQHRCCKVTTTRPDPVDPATVCACGKQKRQAAPTCRACYRAENLDRPRCVVCGANCRAGAFVCATCAKKGRATAKVNRQFKAMEASRPVCESKALARAAEVRVRYEVNQAFESQLREEARLRAIEEERAALAAERVLAAAEAAGV